MMYRSSLVSSGYYNKTVWMDVRGNHDNTNQNSTRQHYYYQYGTCRDEERVYNRIIRHSFGNYCFIGVDATLSPCNCDFNLSSLAPGCIMTYFGYVPRPDQQKLKHFLKEDEYGLSSLSTVLEISAIIRLFLCTIQPCMRILQHSTPFIAIILHLLF